MAAWPWLGKYCNYPGIGVPLASYPNLARWIMAVEERPAYRRVHEPFKLLFKAGLVAQRTASASSLDRFFGRGEYFRV